MSKMVYLDPLLLSKEKLPHCGEVSENHLHPPPYSHHIKQYCKPHQC